MVQPYILEGTWEEVSEQLSKRADEMRRYGNLRLIVVPDETAPENYQDILSKLYAAADNLVPEKPAPFADPNKAQVAKAIKEKFRKQGLNV